MKNIAIIPARAGSKRLPGKNIKEFAGKPLISWSIEAALLSDCFDIICISSDCDEVINLVSQYKVDVPFKRPDHLSSDSASSIDVVIHAIEYYQQNGIIFDTVTLLQPTSPLRSSTNITEGFEVFQKYNANAVIGVTELDHPTAWSCVIDEDSSLTGFVRNLESNKRSQDYQAEYRINGALYISDVKKLMEYKSFFIPDKIFAYKMKNTESIDIDTELDFIVAESIKAYQSNGNSL